MEMELDQRRANLAVARPRQLQHPQRGPLLPRRRERGDQGPVRRRRRLEIQEKVQDRKLHSELFLRRWVVVGSLPNGASCGI